MFECRWGVVCWGSAAEDLARGTVCQHTVVQSLDKATSNKISSVVLPFPQTTLFILKSL